MPPRLLASERLRGSSRRAKATRALIFGTLLLCAASCLAPGLYASTDCDRWVKEYRQGLLQARAARRLRLAKTRFLVAVHRTPSSTPHRHIRHRMGPLEALRRFQVDCGTLDDLEPTPTPIALNLPFLPIETIPLETTTIAELTTPALIETPVPNVFTPVDTFAAALPGEVPEPGTWLLVLTGAALSVQAYRRKLTADPSVF